MTRISGRLGAISCGLPSLKTTQPPTIIEAC